METATAAIEGFRMAVEAMPSGGVHPPQVSLLDYAGFRIQAGLRDKPTRWEDSVASIAYADEKWSEFASKVIDTPLREGFASSLVSQRTAIDGHDLRGAQAAVTTEFDLVEEPETAFAGK